MDIDVVWFFPSSLALPPALAHHKHSRNFNDPLCCGPWPGSEPAAAAAAAPGHSISISKLSRHVAGFMQQFEIPVEICLPTI